jgi:hypothetical protein
MTDLNQSSRTAGVILVVVSAIVFSSAGIFTKGVSADAWTVIFWRGIAAATFTLIYMILRGGFWAEVKAFGKPALLVTLMGAAGTAAFIPAFKLSTVWVSLCSDLSDPLGGRAALTISRNSITFNSRNAACPDPRFVDPCRSSNAPCSHRRFDHPVRGPLVADPRGCMSSRSVPHRRTPLPLAPCFISHKLSAALK